ncbi:hypothetical protein C6P45_004631 [Maudiozyma exigua]|uniref:Peroxisome assembly protein 22 n=1 Tax=Maudiozyma exigua TaxID=34358 RepID=A0A9P6WA24_MAUEX|nr:hypothetical protein C6P45_004631 [Kazachstania exigua]
MAPSGRRTSTSRLIGYGAALTIAIGTTAWLLWNSSKDEDKDMRATNTSQLYKSKCIIVTNSASDSPNIKWAKILADPNVVLIIPPKVEFPQSAYENHVVDSKDIYKIIHCNTMAGVWACVKSLKKDELVLNSNDLGENVPVDIVRYVKHISNVEDMTSVLDEVE